MKYKNIFKVLLVISFAALSGCCKWCEVPIEPDPTDGMQFVGVWQISTICGTQHFTDHTGAGAHAQKGGWYAIYPKGKVDGKQVFGMMISEEFADYQGAGQAELINWNKIELHYEKRAQPVHTGDPCGVVPGNVTILETNVAQQFHTTPAKLHDIEIWLYDDGSGNRKPLVSFDHDTGTMHKGIIH